MVDPRSPAYRGDRPGMCQDQINVWEDGAWTRSGGPSEDHGEHSTQAQGTGCLALRVIGIHREESAGGPTLFEGRI